MASPVGFGKNFPESFLPGTGPIDWRAAPSFGVSAARGAIHSVCDGSNQRPLPVAYGAIKILI